MSSVIYDHKFKFVHNVSVIRGVIWMKLMVT